MTTLHYRIVTIDPFCNQRNLIYWQGTTVLLTNPEPHNPQLVLIWAAHGSPKHKVQVHDNKPILIDGRSQSRETIRSCTPYIMKSLYVPTCSTLKESGKMHRLILHPLQPVSPPHLQFRLCSLHLTGQQDMILLLLKYQAVRIKFRFVTFHQPICWTPPTTKSNALKHLKPSTRKT